MSAPSASAAATANTAAREVQSGLDLLAMVPAKIAVSSAVRNPRDLPEYLVDGNPYTAWNGRTGDLVGAWIAFRVPRDVHVDAIELTPGYVRLKGEEDLFTKNHRIQRIELFRDGKSLTTAALDVQSRTLQRVPVDTGGGEFKVVVKQTLPGSELRWREVVVSEFRVLGKAGAERRPSGTRLSVSVGSLDATTPQPVGHEIDLATDAIALELQRTFPSIENFCREFLVWAKDHAAAEVDEAKQWNDGEPVAEPICTQVRVPVLEHAVPPWTGATGVRLAWAFRDATRLFAVTAKGFRPLPIYFDDRFGNPMGCPSIWSRERVDRLRVEQGWLIATIDGTGPSVYGADGHLESRAYQRGLAMCRETGRRLRCLELNPQYDRALAAKVVRPSGNHEPGLDAVPWEYVEEFHVNANGDVSRLRIR